MAEAEYQKTVRGLECCILRNPEDKPRCDECEYEGKCVNRLMMDALELLKKQEPVEPIRMHHTADKYRDHYKCKICGSDLYFEQCFCDCCGRETKWDEWKDC